MTKQKREWMIPLGLVFLGIVPVIAGAVRVFHLVTGEPNIETERSAPFLPLAFHIGAASVFSLMGAFQFAPEFRKRHRTWHRLAGTVAVSTGFLTALTGLWLTLFYPSGALDGLAVFLMRIFVGIAMTTQLAMSLRSLKKRDFPAHGAWMIRAYAIALGAGTQVFTHIPWIVFQHSLVESTRALSMGAGWALNIAFAEWLIRRTRSPSTLEISSLTQHPHRIGS